MARKIIMVVAILFSLSFTALGSTGGMLSSGGELGKESVWMYQKPDGTYAENEWVEMWGNWYYFGEYGQSKQNTWAEINGKWYYFDQWSVMLSDTTTPDGYQVGSDGAWIQ